MLELLPPVTLESLPPDLSQRIRSLVGTNTNLRLTSSKLFDESLVDCEQVIVNYLREKNYPFNVNFKKNLDHLDHWKPLLSPSIGAAEIAPQLLYELRLAVKKNDDLFVRIHVKNVDKFVHNDHFINCLCKKYVVNVIINSTDPNKLQEAIKKLSSNCDRIRVWIGECNFDPVFEKNPDTWGLVWGVYDKAFYDVDCQPNLEGLTNLTIIGAKAFYHAETQPNLQGLTNLVEIGERAFYSATGQPNLQGLISLKTIGNQAFFNATGLPNLQGLISLKTIGNYAFYKAQGQPNLSGLTSLQNIGEYAFWSAEGRANMEGLTSLQNIGDYAFYKALDKPDLQKLTNLETIGDSAFYNADDETNLQNLKNLRTIGNRAFAVSIGVPNLQGLEKLETIGIRAFWFATGLPDDLRSLKSLKYIGNEAFGNYTSMAKDIVADIIKKNMP